MRPAGRRPRRRRAARGPAAPGKAARASRAARPAVSRLARLPHSIEAAHQQLAAARLREQPSRSGSAAADGSRTSPGPPRAPRGRDRDRGRRRRGPRRRSPTSAGPPSAFQSRTPPATASTAIQPARRAWRAVKLPPRGPVAARPMYRAPRAALASAARAPALPLAALACTPPRTRPMVRAHEAALDRDRGGCRSGWRSRAGCGRGAASRSTRPRWRRRRARAELARRPQLAALREQLAAERDARLGLEAEVEMLRQLLRGVRRRGALRHAAGRRRGSVRDRASRGDRGAGRSRAARRSREKLWFDAPALLAARRLGAGRRPPRERLRGERARAALPARPGHARGLGRNAALPAGDVRSCARACARRSATRASTGSCTPRSATTAWPRAPCSRPDRPRTPGLRAGDLILRYDGRTIFRAGELQRATTQGEAGRIGPRGGAVRGTAGCDA